MKRFFRCIICNDLHYGITGPKICPTCGSVNKYIDISPKEAKMILGLPAEDEREFDRQKIKEVFESFTETQGFKLNPDQKRLDFLYDGLMTKEKQFGLLYCPCRLETGNFQKDLELICPCNFFIQETYKEQERCWCGLFFKEKPL